MQRILLAVVLSLFALTATAKQDKPVNCNKAANEVEKAAVKVAKDASRAEIVACAQAAGPGKMTAERKACEKAAKAKEDVAAKAAKDAAHKSIEACKAAQVK